MLEPSVQVLRELSADPSVEELAGALYARGLLALAGSGAIEVDVRMAGLGDAALAAAAGSPGLERLRSRIAYATERLDDPEDRVAALAEEALADVLDTVDAWSMRARGLAAIGRGELAAEVEASVGRAERLLLQDARALEGLSWMAPGRRGAAADPGSTAWRLVPDGAALPAPLEAPVDSDPDDATPEDDDLALAALGWAGAALEARIARAVQGDPSLRERFEAFLDAAPEFLDHAGARVSVVAERAAAGTDEHAPVVGDENAAGEHELVLGPEGGAEAAGRAAGDVRAAVVVVRVGHPEGLWIRAVEGQPLYVVATGERLGGGEVFVAAPAGITVREALSTLLSWEEP